MKKIFWLVLLLLLCFSVTVFAADVVDNYSDASSVDSSSSGGQNSTLLKDLPPPESDNPSIIEKNPRDTFNEFISRGDFFQLDIYGINDNWNWNFNQTQTTPTSGNNYGFLIGARLDFTKYVGIAYEYQTTKVPASVPFVNVNAPTGLSMPDTYSTVSDLNLLFRVTSPTAPVQAKWLLGYRWNTLSTFGEYGSQGAGGYVSLSGVQTGVLVESLPIWNRLRLYGRGEISIVSWNVRPGFTVETIPHVEFGAAYDYTASFSNNVQYTNSQWLYGLTFRF